MNPTHKQFPILDYQLGMLYIFMYISLISGNVFLYSITTYIFAQRYIDILILKKPNSITTSIFISLYSLIEFRRTRNHTGKHIYSFVIISILILMLNTIYNKISLEEIFMGILYLILFYNIEQDLLKHWKLYEEDKQKLFEFISL